MIKIGNIEPSLRHDYSDVAVILPAHNEGVAVEETIQGFLRALPGCAVVVCDNASTDDTARVAQRAGAVVINEPVLGKGNAMRRLLATVEADIYVMADADATYEADTAREMIELMERQHLDMVTGVRIHTDKMAYRCGHIWGNKLFNRLFGGLFKTHTQDVFSGYRVLSGRFARALPVQAAGFEIETEMTAVAAVLKLATGELPVNYYPRPAGSFSKLHTYKDGARILRTYVRLLRHFHPKTFYGFLSVLAVLGSLMVGVPVILEFIETGLVPRFPSAILASSLGVIAVLLLMLGLLLESLAKNRVEQRQLMLLLKDR
ncbi:glycosyltransferase family 2 protein [Paraperlucidibaca sp.]|jgi:glycosyltransferase involved in cell wall biosynthesis|uniref:glycosyltransferase family 2 protein n=1 Tax=Paraperlucidibaca sp. TaxID=2708021 RepID=UPI0030F45606